MRIEEAAKVRVRDSVFSRTLIGAFTESCNITFQCLGASIHHTHMITYVVKGGTGVE